MKDKKIVLVSCNMFVDIDHAAKSESRFVPEGLLYLSTPLLAAGFDVEICDLAKGDDLSQHAAADVYGVTGLPNQYTRMQVVIREIRRSHPRAKIILGGPFVTCALEWLRDLLDFDMAVVGEGESVIVSAVIDVLNGVSGKKVIATNHAVKTADFCHPALEKIDIRWYLNGWHRPINYSLPYPTINNIVLSRGCPRSCNFCRQPFGKRIRVMPKENISYILESYARAGAKSVRFQDDNWQYLGIETIKHVLQKLADLGLQAAFNSRVDDLSDKFLREISQFNVIKQICFGVESLSQQSLDAMKKGISVEEIKRVVGLCRKYGIDPAFFIMVGTPNETSSSIETTLDLIEVEKVFPQCTFLLPIPSTIYWEDFLKRYSVIEAFSMSDGWDVRQSEAQKIFYNISDVSDRELLDYYSRLKKLQNNFRKEEECYEKTGFGFMSQILGKSSGL